MLKAASGRAARHWTRGGSGEPQALDSIVDVKICCRI